MIKTTSPVHAHPGFTLIELLIVCGLLAMIFVSVSSLFMTSLASGLRTTLWQELRSEGTYAMTQMGYLLRNSTSIIDQGGGIICNPSMDAIAFDNFDATKSLIFVTDDGPGSNTFLVVETIPDGQLSFEHLATSANATLLTSRDVNLEPNGSDPYFTCNLAGEYPYVTISFQITKQTESIRPISQQFRRTVILRNS